MYYLESYSKVSPAMAVVAVVLTPALINLPTFSKQIVED